jgi:hypothetical protein
MKRLALIALCLLASCGGTRQPLQAPDRTESFCPDKLVPRGTAVASIVGSASDHVVDRPFPPEAALRAGVKKNTGVIAHWDDQELLAPQTAKALGVEGEYLKLTTAFIDNQNETDQSRLIYIVVATPSGPRDLILRAYDVQNVCVEGTPLQ